MIGYRKLGYVALNFKTSDEIDGRIRLMRCFPNPLHHSLAIADAARATRVWRRRV